MRIKYSREVANYEKFKKGEIHVICPASNGFTFYDSYAMQNWIILGFILLLMKLTKEMR